MPFPDSTDDALLVGIPQVDQEHAALIGEIARLLGPPVALLDSERFSEVLSRLGGQLGRHFDHEERIIARSGLTGEEVASHYRAHREILEQYTALQLDLMSRTELDQVAVLSMIKTWVIEHLIEFDLKLRPGPAAAA